MSRIRFIEIALLITLAAALAFFGYIGYQAIPKPTPTPIPRQTFDGALAIEQVQAQMRFGPRPTGSEANLRLGDYITQTLQALGWQTTIQDFTYRDTPARNILARRPAQAKTASPKHPIVLLGAHYDTRLFADNDPDVGKRDEPVPGANDGASGVAVLLELARSLDSPVLKDEVWLAFFDAEDNGRINGWDFSAGSRFMAQNLPATPEVVIVVDMIGDADQQIYLEHNSDQKYQNALWRVAAKLGYQAVFIPQLKWTMTDDHIPFKEIGIPAVDIIDFDYPYWHTTQDTTDKLSADSLERVGRVLEVWLEETR
jgi:Zn-dependent M28 family amino/carboxypeptidase